MQTLHDKLAVLDWQHLTDSLNQQGYAIIKRLLAPELCRQLITSFDADDTFRKTVVMEKYRFGSGKYRYWQYPLPSFVQHLREALYPPLAQIANQWSQTLSLEQTYPPTLQAFLARCHQQGQLLPHAIAFEISARRV